MTKKDGDPGDTDPDDKDPGDTDPDEDGPDGDPDDTDTDPDDDFTPPTREEVERMRATMRARKEERDRARAELRELKAGRAGKGGDDAGKDDDARRRDDEQAAERDRWRTSAARSAAAAQLTAAGFSGSAKQARNLTKLLDLTEAEPDKDGDFDFGDEIDDLKDEYPMLFRSGDEPSGRRARTTTADRGRDAGRDDTDDPTTRTSKAMLRRMGRRV